MLVNSGRDLWAAAMGGQVITTYTGTNSTAATATTFTTDGVNIPANSVAGQVVVRGAVYGVILSNTSAANSVLTIDKWYTVTDPGGAAAATPAVGVWAILPGAQPAFWMAITATATAPALSDTVLTGEIATAGGGLVRAITAWAHTAGTNTYTLSKTYTANGSDTLPVTIAQMGVFNAANNGRLTFRTLVSPTATLSASGDNVAITDTITGS